MALSSSLLSFLFSGSFFWICMKALISCFLVARVGIRSSWSSRSNESTFFTIFITDSTEKLA
jgi:hypothetical protein